MAKRKTSKPKYIYEYWNGINDGSITVGKWVRLAYEMIITGLAEKKYIYKPKKATLALRFITEFCRHHEGGKGWHAGDLIKLELWQKAFVETLFGLYAPDGTRAFQEIFLVVARKNGKTLLMSAISAFLAYTEERGSKIFMIAPKLDQANICFNGLAQMINMEPELSSLARKRRTDIYIPSIDTTIKPIAFNDKKSDGLNPSATICDEIAAWPAVTGKRQYSVIKSARGARRQPLILCITTAGYIENGPYDELMARSTQLLLGNSKETRLLPIIYMIDDESKWDDITELKKANPNLGITITESDMREWINTAKTVPSEKTEFLTKRCNIKQNSSEAWLSAKTINAAFQQIIPLEEMAHSYCVCGIDLSHTTDLTALSLVIEKDNILNVYAKYWLPRGRIQEAIERDGLPYDTWVDQGYIDLSGDMIIDYHDLEEYLLGVMQDYEILPLVVGYDKWSSTYLVDSLKTQGLKMDDVRQGPNLNPVILEFESLLLEGKINIADENPITKMHMADVALKKMKDNRVMLVKIRDVSTVHIDGVLATLDALTVRQKWYEQYGDTLKN